MKMILIGIIVNTHGLHGELKILSNSDFKKYRFKKGKTIIISYNKKEYKFTIRRHKDFSKYDILSLKEINSIEEAEKYKNCKLYIDSEDKIDLDKDEYHYNDILNINTYDQENNYIGIIYRIDKLKLYDLWYIKRENKKDLIIPFKDFFIKKVDIKNKKVIINLIKGM